MMYYFFLIAIMIVPVAAQAAPSFKGVVGSLLQFGQLLVMVIFAITFLVVLWKIVDTWILHGDDPVSIQKGKKVIITSIIVLVIMSGIWGILQILTTSFQGVVNPSSVQTQFNGNVPLPTPKPPASGAGSGNVIEI